MHFQFIIAPPTPALTPPPVPTIEATPEMLRQLLDVQREQLRLMQASAAREGDGHAARWRNFFDRWHEDFPHLPVRLRETLPTVERAFLRLLDEMVHHLKAEDTGDIDDSFSLGEFLDRYGTRVGQIGTILNLMGQMAEAVRTEGT